MDAGLKLKRIRENLGLRYRQVETASNLIAQKHGSSDFIVGLSRLADIENKGVVPSLHRLYSLCAIYRLDIAEVLRWYGIDLGQVFQDAAYVKPTRTHLMGFQEDSRGAVPLPLKLDPGIDFRRTTYLSRVIQQWGKVPLSLLETLDIRDYRYGLIGSEDFLMYPLLRPGALVQIDESQRQIRNTGWSHEFERPIYFFELRDGYACCWCNLAGDHLILQPHPGSPCEPVVLERAVDADVVGRVVGVAMQLDFAEPGTKESPARTTARARSSAGPR
jgi:transcriptional regulator with XRE-family HTH domain